MSRYVAVTLPAGPLLPHLRLAVANAGGIAYLAERLAVRFDQDQRSWEREVSRLLTGERGHMHLDLADRLCCALHLHPTLVWPREWARRTA